MSSVKLRTPVPVAQLDEPVGLADQIVSVGSCFSEYMSRRLAENHFRVAANPHGILYNPASMSRCIRRDLSKDQFSGDDVFFHEELWKSFEFHGAFAEPDSGCALEGMNATRERAREALGHCDWLFVTFGTAFAWYHQSQPDCAVANCHRLPAAQFERRLLGADEIVADWGSLLDGLFGDRPKMQVLISVSPVRHLRQRAEENSISKAHLLIAVNELASSHGRVHRFPAYEIVMDELRDYRFFDRDLVHPNELAQEVIWERFCDSCLNPDAQEFVRQFRIVLEGLGHRPRREGGGAHRTFVRNMLRSLDELGGRFPDVLLGEVRRHFAALAEGHGPEEPGAEDGVECGGS